MSVIGAIVGADDKVAAQLLEQAIIGAEDEVAAQLLEQAIVGADDKPHADKGRER